MMRAARGLGRWSAGPSAWRRVVGWFVAVLSLVLMVLVVLGVVIGLWLFMASA